MAIKAVVGIVLLGVALTVGWIVLGAVRAASPPPAPEPAAATAAAPAPPAKAPAKKK